MKSLVCTLCVVLLAFGCADDDPSKNGSTNSTTADAGDGGQVEDMTGSDVGVDMATTIDMGVDAEVDMAMMPNPCGFRDPSNLQIYAGIDDVDDAELRDALLGLVSPHQGYTYDDARVEMYTDIDVHDGLIECIYTGATYPPDGTRSPGDITTEHSWPRNEGAESFPAEGDIHHLFPATAMSNNRRGVHPFGVTNCDEAGEPACDWEEGGSQLGPGVDGREFVFEVRPKYRGDIARAHFYFAVRYELAIDPLEEAVLRDWHCEDPPDLEELIRNDDIDNRQQNRNPFVDRPRLVERIADF